MIFDPDINGQMQEVIFSRKFHPSLTFNSTSVTQAEIQKHLGMFLESKLDFKQNV